MKLLVTLVVVFMAVLLQGIKPSSSQGLQCYFCEYPPMNCYKKQTITCDAGQDTCVKAYTKISGYDGSPNNLNEYNKYMDIMVWERVCMTKNQCEDYKNKKINTYLKVTCCDTDLCNV